MDSDAEEGRETCGLLLEEIDRLAHVTSTLVGFARPLTLERRPAAAAEIVERVRLLGRQMLRDRAVQLDARRLWRTATPVATERARSTYDLEGDPDLLCQVLLGLLENAAEASPPGGTVELGWSVTDRR